MARCDNVATFIVLVVFLHVALHLSSWVHRGFVLTQSITYGNVAGGKHTPSCSNYEITNIKKSGQKEAKLAIIAVIYLCSTDLPTFSTFLILSLNACGSYVLFYVPVGFTNW